MIVEVAADAASDAPWWGVPVAAGVFLIIGALITFAANYFVARNQLQAHERARWDADLLNLTADLIEVCEDIVDVNNERSVFYLVDANEREAKFVSKIDEAHSLAIRIQLLAPNDMSTAARDLCAGAIDASGFNVIRAEDDFPAPTRTVTELKNELAVLARRELRSRSDR